MKRASAVVALVLAVAALGACRRKDAPPAAATGSITGSVAFTGNPNMRPRLDRSADSACGSAVSYNEGLIVNSNRTVRNVVVRLVSPLPVARPPAPLAAVVLDQKDCVYSPHVVTLAPGQPLEIRTSDGARHAVRVSRGDTTLAREEQGPGAAPLVEKFSDDGGLLRVRCEAHPWTDAWVAMAAHPWIAVTGPDGKFEIGNLPPGRYQLESWHERLGTKTLEVTVGAGPAEAAFAYDGHEK